MSYEFLNRTAFFALLNEPNENNYSTVEIMIAGEWEHQQYGKITITKKLMEAIRHNFERFNMAGRIPFDFNHGSERPSADAESAKAAGWIQKLIVVGDHALHAVVQWTDEAARRIRAGEYRLVSPAYTADYQHPAAGGKKIGPWLHSVALTNRPFLKNLEGGMQPVALSEEAARHFSKGELDMKFIEIEVSGKKIRVAEEDADEARKLLTEKIAKDEAEAQKLEAKTIELEAENKQLIKQLADAQAGDDEQVKLLRDTVGVQTAALKDAADRLAQIEADAKAVKAEGLLDAAVRSHKLSKAERDSEVYQTLALRDPEVFAALVAAKHPVAPIDEQGGGGDAGLEDADRQALVFNDLIDQRFEVLRIKNPTDSERHIYSRALREVTAENPTLAVFDGQSI